jgi:hypothetical protein
MQSSERYLIAVAAMDLAYSPCSAELISTAYQPWNSVFLSQQISHSRLISQKTACRTGPLSRRIWMDVFIFADLLLFFWVGSFLGFTLRH